MTDDKTKAGVFATGLQRFLKLTMPELARLKKKVDGGAVLAGHELEYVNGLFDNAAEMDEFFKDDAEYRKLRDKAVGLVNQILEQSAANEEAD